MEALDGGLLTGAGLGLLLGLRHALDPDHVAAVSALVAERSGLRRACLIGACWGTGHALSLTLAGGLLLALKLSVPGVVAGALEAVVAAMLVAIGLEALRSALGFRVHAHAHAHGGLEHVHFHAHRAGQPHVHGHAHPLAAGWKPFLVGLVHGLAGSAGVALLALGTAATPLAGLVCVATLGAGALLGMVALGALLSLPLTLFEVRHGALQRRLQLAAGGWSVGLGLYLLGRHLPVAELVALSSQGALRP